MKNYSVIEHIALGPKDIAESAGGVWDVGGTVLKVAEGQPWREVPAYNAPPPVGVGANTSRLRQTSESWIYWRRREASH